jgi:hypothetical protein
MTSLGHVVRRSIICMTSLRVSDVFATMHRLYHYNHVIRKNITRFDYTIGNGKNLVEMFE